MKYNVIMTEEEYKQFKQKEGSSDREQTLRFILMLISMGIGFLLGYAVFAG